MNEITDSVQKVNDLVAEIALASQEQSTGIAEINDGLSQVNDVVQQNSSISSSTASIAEDLSAQTVQLHNLMGKFQIDESQISSELVLQENLKQ